MHGYIFYWAAIYFSGGYGVNILKDTPGGSGKGVAPNLFF